jgi:CMP-N,N'-diacetyllegionaminic acid synthase
LLGGKPLIAWTIQAAKKSKDMYDFIVSTNDDEIAAISSKYGAPVPFRRPPALSVDCDTTLVLQHAIEMYEEQGGNKVDWVVCLQPTSPFRLGTDIDECIRVAKATNADTVVSIMPVHQHPEWMFQMKPFNHELESYANARLEGENLVWQNLPPLYYPNGAVYVTKRAVIMKGKIYGDKKVPYLMPSERSLDMETELDFIIGEAMIPYLAKKEPKLQMSWLIE